MKYSFASIMVLVSVVFMDLLGGSEMEMMVTSFPELEHEFKLTPFWVEALLSLNFIGFCISLFFVGSLSDRYGRKPIILLGVIIFLIGCALCLWAPSYQFLLVGRFLQGIGVAAPANLCFLIIADAYPIKQQQALMGILNGFMNTAIAASPVAGCYLTMYFHWQGNFVALLLFGLVVLVMTIFFIPNSKPPELKETLSLSGYIPIFKSKPLLLLLVYMPFLYAPYPIFIGIAPILYREDLGVSITHYGYYQGAMAFIFAMGSVVFGLLINKYDQKKMLYLSQLMIISGAIMVAVVIYIGSTSPLLITLSMLPWIIGSIIPSIIIYPIILNFIPSAKGRVASILRAGHLILAALGLELAGYFYNKSFCSVGIILIIMNIIAVIVMVFAMKNPKIMNFAQE